MKRVLIICVVMLLIVIGLIGAAWLRMYLPVHYDPIATWGEERDSSGRLVRSIDLQQSYHVTGWLPGPDGGRETRKTINHYFLNRPGQPRKELTFLPTLDPAYIDGDFLPVAGTSAWVMKTNPELQERVILFVFDANGLLHQREVPVSSRPFSSPEPGLNYRFTNGNKTMQYTYLRKAGSYDVMTDTLK